MSSATRSRPSARRAGLGAVARQLGVERTHLWRVVTGRRESKSLLERVRRLGLNWDVIQK